MNAITKWLVKLLPLDTLLESAFDRLVDAANERMTREGTQELIMRFTKVGADIAKEAFDSCEMLEDALIDDVEKLELKQRFIPKIVELITKALNDEK